MFSERKPSEVLMALPRDPPLLFIGKHVFLNYVRHRYVTSVSYIACIARSLSTKSHGSTIRSEFVQSLA